MRFRRIIKKSILFFGGLLLLALGIALSTVSGLGVSPLNSLAFVLGELTGLEMGYTTMLLYVVYVLLEIPIKGKAFQVKDLLQIPVAILFGFLVNWTKTGLPFPVCSGYYQRLACCFFSIVLIAAGTTIYVIPKMALQAPEGLILAICERWNLKFGTVKTVFDMTVVCLAVLMGLICVGRVIGIREGTLLAAVGVGIVVNLCNKTIKPLLTSYMEE